MRRLLTPSTLVFLVSAVCIFLSAVGLQKPYSEELFIAGKALIIFGTFLLFLDR